MIKSKTMWFSILLMLFGTLMDNSDYLKEIVSPKYFSILMITIGIIVGFLRILTTQPLSEK